MVSPAARYRGLLRRASGALRSLTRIGANDGTVRVQGHRMHLDPGDSLDLARRGYHELPETRVVTRTVRRGDAVVDVGANIGYYTLLLARLVGPAGKVYAFEPDPSNFSILCRNIELNRYDNVVPVQKALSDREGTIELFLCDHNAGMHRAYESILCRRSITVETVTLDGFLERERRDIDFIKIDIEGAEMPAIAGMRAILGRTRRMALLTEYSPAAMWESGSDPEEYVRTLRDLGFAIEAIRQDGSAVPVDPEEMSQNTRRIVSAAEEVLRSLGGKRPEDPAAVIASITERLRSRGHAGGLTENLLCLKSPGGADAGDPR